MSSFSVTSASLLEGLRDSRNDRRWTEFYWRYQPPLASFIRRTGLRRHDAEDVAQDTLLAFAAAYREGRYAREKGRLRTWLLGIAKHKISDFKRSRWKEAPIRGDTDAVDFVQCIPDEKTLEKVWDEEWHAAILRAALEEVRQDVEPVTMKAFELYALEGHKPAAVAEQLGISRDSVYQARTRVIARLRELQGTLEEMW